MKQKVRVLVIVTVIIAVIAVGLLLYFEMANSKKEVNVSLSSFDEIETITLNSDFVKSVSDSYEMSFQKLVITPKNKNDFINITVQNDEYFLYKKEAINVWESTCYVFKKNGYFFVLADKVIELQRIVSVKHQFLLISNCILGKSTF